MLGGNLAVCVEQATLHSSSLGLSDKDECSVLVRTRQIQRWRRMDASNRSLSSSNMGRFVWLCGSHAVARG